jgi:hypothetical protein
MSEFLIDSGNDADPIFVVDLVDGEHSSRKLLRGVATPPPELDWNGVTYARNGMSHDLQNGPMVHTYIRSS